MERHPPATSSTEADVVHVYGVQRQGHRETNTYSTARQQDEEEEEDDEERITEEVCLETSSVSWKGLSNVIHITLHGF